MTSAPAGADAVAAAEWPQWGTTARLVVTDRRALPAARRRVLRRLAAVDRAASRFRPNSEVNALLRAGGRPRRVSPLLAELVGAALEAARATDGDVDPTVANALIRLGYDRDPALLDGTPAPGHDLTTLPSCGGFTRVAVRAAVPGWRRVALDGLTLTVPPGVLLDLGATAKGLAADRCAAEVAQRFGVGVLLGLGGDIATAGPAPGDGRWGIRVADHPQDPECLFGLPAGAAVATSSLVRRTSQHEGGRGHPILDPRTGAPAAPVWRSVTVVAHSCLLADTWSTAAMVRGEAAVAWLGDEGIPARLLRADGTVVTTPAWPAGTG